MNTGKYPSFLYKRGICTALFIILLLASDVFADNSLNVPPHHWSYEVMERLATVGVADMSGLSKRPISRLQMARKIAFVVKKTEGDDFDYSALNPSTVDMIEKLLERLIEEFRPELVELGVGLGDDDESERRFLKASVLVDSEKAFTNLKLNENVLENQQGWHLKDGFNLKAQIESRIRIKDIIGFSIAPGIRRSKDDTDFTVEKGYAQFSLSNIRVQLGRDSLWLGPGYHGSLLLSDNALPFDMLKLNNDKPLRLPWVFRRLGPLDIEYFITRLEKKRQVHRAYFLGFRIEATPFPFLNLGFSRTVIFGGKGAPRPSLTDYLQIFIPEHENRLGVLDNDQKIAIDFRISIPFINKILSFLISGVEAYGEIAAEDDTTDITQLQPGHGINAGILITNILRNKGLDIRIEFAQNDDVWYVHHAHGAYKYKGSLMGHHMGGDADDIFIRVSKEFLDELTFGLQFSRERLGRSKTNIQTKNELRIDLTFLHTADTLLSAAYEFEDIENLENIANKTARNNIFLLEVNKRF